MNRKFFSKLSILALLALMLALVPSVTANEEVLNLPIPVDIDHLLREKPAPAQPSATEAEEIASSGSTTASQCSGDDSTQTISIPSFDPEHPGSQDVVFFKETAGNTKKKDSGMATLWVAWDFLDTATGRQDVITCDQLEYLQGSMDSIIETDVHYFGKYENRPKKNENIDVMIYNIVDENYYDEGFPFYIAGFFWGALNEFFIRNMIFIDTLDWENRLGPDAANPYLYEGTVAHELEHLIHNDHDPDEVSWVDEGMADLAEYLNGFGHPTSHVVYYLAFHRTPLTVWGGGLEDYGASYLFQLYLLENFGSQSGGVWDNGWTKMLIDTQANSLDGIAEATGETFNTLYDAWILANYVDDPSLDGAGGYPIGYDEISLTPFVSNTFSPWSIYRSIDEVYGSTNHGNLPIDRYYGGYVSGTVEWPVGAVSPYTPIYTTYAGISPEMDIYLRGEAASGVAPKSGTHEVASGGGNLVTDRMLELNVAVSGTLTFWTWFDIEEEWDYGFIEVSTGGGSWTPIPGTITTPSSNPNASTAWANSLVGGQASTDTAITGSSLSFEDPSDPAPDGWVEAVFELPAASDVRVRLSYYTDEAVNGQGWFIDDVIVDSFADDFEAGTGNWSLGGWQWTTGLFDNDWIAAYVNPVYKKGKFSYLDYGYTAEVLNPPFEYELGAADTNGLNNTEATVVFSNRPGDSPFDGGYLYLVEKGNASN